MRNKKGISLIVLVITIIVMIILAASVVISLSNTGIIDKAGQAVDATDAAQVQNLAALAWADAYMDNYRGNDLKTKVEEALTDAGVALTDYNITVSDTGVEVEKKGSSSNKTPIMELTALQPGDFVDYKAGNWTQAEITAMGSLYSGEALPTSTNKYMFGGFKAGGSKDASITPYSTYANTYSGWRVLSVENGVVKIIHAGTPEGYYHPIETNGAYKSEYILRGRKNASDTSNITDGVTPRSWAMYENNLAEPNSAHAMTYAEANAIEKTNDLRKTGSYYWLASAHDGRNLYDVVSGADIRSNGGRLCFGVRPVITLKSEVQVVGGEGTSAVPYELVIQ